MSIFNGKVVGVINGVFVVPTIDDVEKQLVIDFLKEIEHIEDGFGKEFMIAYHNATTPMTAKIIYSLWLDLERMFVA